MLLLSIPARDAFLRDAFLFSGEFKHLAEKLIK